MLRICLISPPRNRILWHSVREIVPALEKSWQTAARGKGRIRKIYPETAAQVFAAQRVLCASNLIVVTQLDRVTLGMIRILRRDFRVSAPLLIHVHGDGTAGGLPFNSLEGLLSTRDLFIASCTAEK